ncbi:MAG TPA: LuxR C-terminal-related transcriptional regulator [Solirubrobacteraceae bacterium]|jgi:PAS domain S-box-containing protein
MADVARSGEWGTLFSSAFVQSRNPMALLDGHRRVIDINGAFLSLLGHRSESLIGHHVYEFIVGGPLATAAEWESAVRRAKFTGSAELRAADDGHIAVQWAATTEVITGQRLVLFVTLSTSRWGASFRRNVAERLDGSALTARELEVVRLVALGASGPEIADELQIAHDTVRAHARNAMGKVGARSRAQLVAKAIGEGLVSR